MLTQEQRLQLSDILRPASPPREIDNVYTDDQRERLLNVVRTQGPWRLIIAQHFASPEELMATMSGAFPEGFTPSLDMFLTATFRGYLANYGTVLYPELHDVFYNKTFVEQAKSYWNAEYAKPEMMLFNINGPCANRDPGHLDSPSFRGVRHSNAPTWLTSVMGKSGLFTDYLIKMAQVITWFSHDETSGFTYWPEGPLKAPKRILPPVYNRGVVVQNEMMVHRGEANGPLDKQTPAGLAFDTVFTGDPAVQSRLVAALLVLAVMQFPGAVAFALDGALIGAQDMGWLGRQAVFNIAVFLPAIVPTLIWPSLGLAGIWGAQLCWMGTRALVNHRRWRRLERIGFRLPAAV